MIKPVSSATWMNDAATGSRVQDDASEPAPRTRSPAIAQPHDRLVVDSELIAFNRTAKRVSSCSRSTAPRCIVASIPRTDCRHRLGAIHGGVGVSLMSSLEDCPDALTAIPMLAVAKISTPPIRSAQTRLRAAVRPPAPRHSRRGCFEQHGKLISAEAASVGSELAWCSIDANGTRVGPSAARPATAARFRARAVASGVARLSLIVLNHPGREQNRKQLGASSALTGGLVESIQEQCAVRSCVRGSCSASMEETVVRGPQTRGHRVNATAIVVASALPRTGT
jgi:hypothetical protein